MSDVAHDAGPAMTRRSLMESVAGMMFLAGARDGQGKPAPARPVFQQRSARGDAEGMVGDGRRGRPTSRARARPAHRHPGITIAYVLEGEIRSKVGRSAGEDIQCGPDVHRDAGELHAVSANASTTKPAKLLALLLAEKGKPLTTPEK